jgi:hypothetical protein
LQQRLTEQSEAKAEFNTQLGHQLQLFGNMVTNLQVSFMNTADVTVVITVIANFQIQIVLDL